MTILTAHSGADGLPDNSLAFVRHALASGLFLKIREAGLLLDDHKGGCVLYDKRDQVRELLKEC